MMHSRNIAKIIREARSWFHVCMTRNEAHRSNRDQLNTNLHELSQN